MGKDRLCPIEPNVDIVTAISSTMQGRLTAFMRCQARYRVCRVSSEHQEYRARPRCCKTTRVESFTPSTKVNLPNPCATRSEAGFWQDQQRSVTKDRSQSHQPAHLRYFWARRMSRIRQQAHHRDSPDSFLRNRSRGKSHLPPPPNLGCRDSSGLKAVKLHGTWLHVPRAVPHKHGGGYFHHMPTNSSLRLHRQSKPPSQRADAWTQHRLVLIPPLRAFGI